MVVGATSSPVKNMMIVLHDFHDDFDDGGCYQMVVIDRDLRGHQLLDGF